MQSLERLFFLIHQSSSYFLLFSKESILFPQLTKKHPWFASRADIFSQKIFMKQGVDVSSSIRYEQCIIEVLRASKEVFIHWYIYRAGGELLF